MNWEVYFVIAVLAIIIIALMRNWAPPDLLLLGGALVCGVSGIITPEQVFSGFVNEGTLTIAALFVVAAAMSETGALDTVQRWIFGSSETEQAGLKRLLIPVSTLSAFFNNTPIVAMLLPMVNEWCRKHAISPSRILMPLSFMAILGGTCTLIGTSTHLAVNGLIKSHAPQYEGLHELSLFDMAWVGVPFVLIGALYLLIIGPKLLPDRKDMLERIESDPREYFAEMQVQADCPLVAQSVKEAGLRRLPGLFLMEIARGKRVITPVRPDEVILENDILTFAGIVSTVVDLERKIQGLVPVADESYEASAAERRGKNLCEAVISARSPLVGTSIRDADFRSIYNAAVIAVHRGGGRIQTRIGDIVLHAGDTLLLQAGDQFARLHHNNPDFYLVSDVQGAEPVRHEKRWHSTSLMVLLVILMTLPNFPIVYAAFIVAALMLLSGSISTSSARESIDWPTLITIGASFGIGEALAQSGAAALLAHSLVELPLAQNPYILLLVVYAMTSLFAAIVSSKAAAVLMFPVALAVATSTGVDLNPQPFVLAVMYSAAASLSTPLGYPTNLMVYGPGAYQFSDFVKVGLPLNILLMLAGTYLIPQIWPF